MNIKIVDVREKLMKCWSHDTQKFKNLRDECGTYVFDAVMAVLLGGTGTSTLENRTYISFIFNKMDVSSWKANAGLKSNNVTGTNYSQRGFFNYPNVSNKKIQLEFYSDMTIEEVCEHIKSYPEDFFRRNARNAKSDPAHDFVNTLYKILNYAGFETNEAHKPESQKTEVKKENNQSQNLADKTKIIIEENNIMADMKEVYTFLQQNETPIADSIGYASELLLSELDDALKALKKRRVEAAENDDDILLETLTNYRNTLKGYRDNIESCLSISQSSVKSETHQETNTDMPPEPEESLDEDEQEPVNYALYTVNSQTPHSLHENFIHKKICAFSFERIRYNVNNWKNALVLMCNLLAKENPQKFQTIFTDSRFRGRKNQYFVNRSIPGKTEKIQNTNTYVWVNLSANAIAELMADTLEYFGKDVSNFSVFLRADYTSLHKNE